MKLMLVVLVTLSSLSTACRDRNDNNPPPQITPKTPSEPAAPSWAGNCDVDYSQLQTDRLEQFGIIIEDRGINSEDKIVILNELNSLPDFVLEALGENKIPFRMIEGGVTEFEELSTLKGSFLTLHTLTTYGTTLQD